MILIPFNSDIIFLGKVRAILENSTACTINLTILRPHQMLMRFTEERKGKEKEKKKCHNLDNSPLMSFCPKYEESWGKGGGALWRKKKKKKFPPKSGIFFFFF